MTRPRASTRLRAIRRRRTWRDVLELLTIAAACALAVCAVLIWATAAERLWEGPPGGRWAPPHLQDQPQQGQQP